MKDRRQKPLSVALLAESREVFQEVRLEERGLVASSGSSFTSGPATATPPAAPRPPQRVRVEETFSRPT